VSSPKLRRQFLYQVYQNYSAGGPGLSALPRNALQFIVIEVLRNAFAAAVWHLS
jgi:hypothetical protein